MRHILFVSALLVATFMYASGQVREPPLEKGRIEDLKGVIKVYVGTSDQSPSLPTRTIIETVRKKLPQIIFVSSREDADVWLMLSAEKGTETEVNPDPSMDGHSSAKFVSVLRVAGKIIRFQGRGPSKLVKKFSATGGSTDRSSLARDFAEEFIKLYSKANPNKQSGATAHPEPDATTLSLQAEIPRVQPATSLPPHLKGETGPVAGTGAPTSGPTAHEVAGVSEGEIVRTDTSLVTIHANVIGRDGVPAPVLRQDDFSVYEDDVKQDIAFFEPVDRPAPDRREYFGRPPAQRDRKSCESPHRSSPA